MNGINNKEKVFFVKGNADDEKFKKDINGKWYYGKSYTQKNG